MSKYWKCPKCRTKHNKLIYPKKCPFCGWERHPLKAL